MATKAGRHEESKLEARVPYDGRFVKGEWTFYNAVNKETGRVVGTISQRSGGGWIATLPVFAMEDNGIADVRRKVGYVKGRGDTPQAALAEADRLALMGPEAMDEYTAKEMF